MSYCDWEGLRRGDRCKRCGFELPRDYTSAPKHNCEAGNATEEKAQREFLLGEATEKLLSGFGITQDNYKKAKELFGLAPDCDCPKRIEMLNEWTRQVKDWWRGVRG